MGNNQNFVIQVLSDYVYTEMWATVPTKIVQIIVNTVDYTVRLHIKMKTQTQKS